MDLGSKDFLIFFELILGYYNIYWPWVKSDVAAAAASAMAVAHRVMGFSGGS